jgi:hypothetical protein
MEAAMPMTTKEVIKLNEMMNLIRKQWREACLVQGVPADSKFVIMSPTNEAAIEHNRLMGEFFKLRNRILANVRRRERHQAMKDLGLNRVKGSQGGTYYE